MRDVFVNWAQSALGGNKILDNCIYLQMPPIRILENLSFIP